MRELFGDQSQVEMADTRCMLLDILGGTYVARLGMPQIADINQILKCNEQNHGIIKTFPWTCISCYIKMEIEK